MSKNALRLIERDKCEARMKSKYRDLYDLCLYKAELLRERGDAEEALDDICEALSLCDHLPDATALDRAQVHRKMGECLMELERYEDARRHLALFLKYAKSSESLVEQQRALATLGRCYHLHLEDGGGAELRHKSRDAYMQSLRIAEQIGDAQVSSEEEVAKMKGRIALNLALLTAPNQVGEALRLYQGALYRFKKFQLHDDMCRALSALIGLHLKVGNSAEALEMADILLDRGRQDRRPEVQCEAQILRGQALVLSGAWEAARSAFKRAHRINTTVVEDRKAAVRCLKLSGVLRDFQVRLREAAEPAQRAKIFEQLGDTLQKSKMHQAAVVYYRKAIEDAQRAGLPAKQLGDLHFSVAKTLEEDLCDPHSALINYRKELDFRKDDQAGAAITNLKIARILMSDRKYGLPEIRDALSKALELSQQAGKPSLELECLKELVSLEQLADPKHEARIKELEGHLDDEVTSESSQESDELSDVNDVDISDTSDSDPEYQDGPRRVCRKLEQRRNEKGETPLHTACIRGSLKQVQYLLKMGHGVNVRDHAGWTPLHEAANHGHLEIVMALTEAGADLSNPGGPKCEGVTPLHDAAQNGHLKVVKYLLEKGASPTARNDNGLYPLDCLLSWKSDATLNDEQSLLLGEVEPMLRKTSGVGKRVQNVAAESRDSFIGKPSTYLSMDLEVGEGSLLEADCDNIERNQGPWVNEGSDIWLEDDIRKFGPKSASTMQTTFAAVRKRVRQSSGHDSRPTKPRAKNMRYEDSDNSVMLPKDNQHKNSNEDSLSSSPVCNTVPVPPSGASSFRVRVLDKVLFIPVPQSVVPKKTVKWLALEAGERYMDLMGVRPVLRMTLGDGALLSHSDELGCLVLFPSAEIIGEVESWDMPPLFERYVSECQKRGVPTSSNVIPVLQDCDAQHSFCMPFSKVNYMELVFRALRHQQLLRTFDITGTVLTRTSVAALSICLPTLHSLDSLILRCCLLTPEFLTIISNEVRKSNSKLPCTDLDLSYNPFRKTGLLPLSTLLSDCPNLKVLCLEGCGIPRFDTVLKNLSTLEVLRVAHNPLNEPGLESLGAIFGSNPLKVLDLSGCFPSTRPPFGQILHSLLSRADCHITELRLSYCGLTKNDVEHLNLCESLCKLDLTGNPELAGGGIEGLTHPLCDTCILRDTCE